MQFCQSLQNEQFDGKIDSESNLLPVQYSSVKLFSLEMDQLFSTNQNEVKQCDCSNCSQLHLNNSVRESEIKYRSSTNLPSSTYSVLESPEFLKSSPLTQLENRYFNFLPFVLITIVLSVTVILLVSASVVYFQCKL